MTTIGIDLGTTNSLVAYWDEGKPTLIPNVLGDYLTPSVVSIDDNGEVLVGKIAKERLISHPEVTASVFKRFIGSEKKYQLDKHEFSPEELSSFIIKELKRDAEVYLNQSITSAVISVPAYFNDAQRTATKSAAELAGLQVDRLISEPTAAALAYGLNEQQEEMKFLVFDLGGGTFDVSILEVFDGIFEVKSIAGDNYLGGEDFTNVIITDFIEEHQINREALDSKVNSLLYAQAERCKVLLGMNQDVSIKVTIDEETYEKKYTRIYYEKITTQLILRVRRPIERALRDADVAADELDSIILIGGATRMPMIKSILAKIFGRLPLSHIDPDQTVALGVAVQAALIDRDEALEELILTDICPFTLGVEVVQEIKNDQYVDGYYLPIIERNTPIPVSKVERLWTVRDQQKRLQVEIYQGESRLVKDNLKLGELTINVPPSPKGEQAVDVRYTYDINGILEVEVTSVATKEKKAVIIEQRPGEMSEKEIKMRLEELSAIKIHPRDRAENRLLLARGERIYEEMMGENRERIGMMLRDFDRVLHSQNEQEIEELASILKEQLDIIERWLGHS